jgi:hypothetical protein
VKDRPWETARQTPSEAAAARAERARKLVSRMRDHVAPAPASPKLEVPPPVTQEPDAAKNASDTDYSVFPQEPNRDLRSLTELFDKVRTSGCCIHLALAWPHIPPRAILPWMLREVSRGRRNPPLRTLFVNMGRPALRTLAGIEARTTRLGARGIYRSGVNDNAHGPLVATPSISADAHFYMFLGKSLVENVPLVSIVPHYVSMNDGVFWRDFDEKTLRGFKRYFDANSLRSIRKHLDLLTSASRSPSFAFLMPSHFGASVRREAIARLPGGIDFVVVDMSTHAVRGRDASALLRDILAELEAGLTTRAQHVLITTDCPLRHSFLRRTAQRRQQAGRLGTRVEVHRFPWSSRDKGWEPIPVLSDRAPPIVTTIASHESLLATRLWRHAQELDQAGSLSTILLDGAVALKGMAMTACGADALLAPYVDTHDAYHRIKRERHSFAPHYNKALAEIAAGHAGHLRDILQRDLDEALAVADALRSETPLMRYVRRELADAPANSDILLVLRHPEDAQQAYNYLLDYLTEPGRFTAGVPNFRVTTPNRYYGEIATRAPSCVIWAASPIGGTRAYIGDAIAPAEFRMLVAGQDVVTLDRILDAVAAAKEYHVYEKRIHHLKSALPRPPKEVGDVSIAMRLDLDRPRTALPFVGQGYLLLDGYGKVAAGPGTTFYVLDPVGQSLSPHEARSIDEGDAVFVMSDAIREEIEAVLREKDERGRTFEQSMVDQYKAIVRSGIATLSRQEGKKITAARIHQMLFDQNPALPPIDERAVDYWLQAADRLDVDTPFAARDPVHLEAFLRLMNAGVLARQLADAIRIVRSALQRDGYTNRALFDRLLLDPDSLIQTRSVTFEKLQGLRHEAYENVFPVLEKNIDAGTRSKDRMPQGLAK